MDVLFYDDSSFRKVVVYGAVSYGNWLKQPSSNLGLRS